MQGKDEQEFFQEYRPMTAISIPIFNKKRDEFNKVRHTYYNTFLTMFLFLNTNYYEHLVYCNK